MVEKNYEDEGQTILSDGETEASQPSEDQTQAVKSGPVMKTRRKATERRRNVRGKFRAVLNNARHVLLQTPTSVYVLLQRVLITQKKVGTRGQTSLRVHVGCHGKSQSTTGSRGAGF